ncbi:MAG: ROK family protein [Candidatus Nanopelagicales bacterium]
MPVVLAVDVGGTKLAVGLVDQEGRVLESRRRPTPRAADAEAIWLELWSMVEEVAAGVDVAGVGIGCGGPMLWPSGVVSPLNMPAWRDFPLRARFQERYVGRPVRLFNDAICLAIAEHWRGVGRGHDNVLGMVVSTGVGGGLVLGGRVVEGTTGNAGHIGHVVVDPSGPVCGCGGRGHVESYARGPVIAQWATEQGWLPPHRPATAQDVATDATRGHPVATEALRRAGHAIGVAVASAVHLMDLDVVAVGGGVAQAGSLLFEPLDAALRSQARMDFARRVQVVPTSLGQAAGLVGAAALVVAGDSYWPPGDS